MFYLWENHVGYFNNVYSVLLKYENLLNIDNNRTGNLYSVSHSKVGVDNWRINGC